MSPVLVSAVGKVPQVPVTSVLKYLAIVLHVDRDQWRSGTEMSTSSLSSISPVSIIIETKNTHSTFPNSIILILLDG